MKETAVIINSKSFEDALKSNMEMFADEIAADFKHHFETKDGINGSRHSIVLDIDADCQPGFFIDESFLAYRRGDISLEEIKESFTIAANQTIEMFKERNIKMDSIVFDKDYILSHAICCMCNTKRNMNTLDAMPHREYLDLSIYYKIIYDIDDTDMTGATNVSNDMIAKFDISEEELYEAASKNTAENYPYVTSLLSPFGPRMMDDFVLMMDPMFPMIAITNKAMQYAATFMTNEAMLKKVYDKIGNYYILPSSVHEVIIVKAESDAIDANGSDGLKNMVREVNSTMLVPSDYLSDNIYFFDGTELRIV